MARNPQVAWLEKAYGVTLPASYAAALKDGSLSRAEGRRPTSLPGWAASMCQPLTFEPDIVCEVFGGAWWTEDHDGLVPFARFLTDDGEGLHDMDDFLAIDISTGEVKLCDSEGDVRVAARSIDAFLRKLRAAGT